MKKLFLILVVLLFAASAFSADVKLVWDANSETDLAGYKVYRSDTEGGPYTKTGNNIVVPETEFTDRNVPNGTWYYAVTAFNTGGSESGYSNEVNQTINEAPGIPQNVKIVVIVTVNVTTE